MKTRYTLLALFISVWFTATAQPSKCEEAFNAFEEQFKSRNYTEASVQLDYLLKKCPKFNEKLYTYGETILKYNTEAYAATAKETQQHVDSLLSFYSQYERNFPANKNGNAYKKAMVLKDFKMATDQEVYTMLDEALKKDKSVFTDYNAIETYFNLYLQHYEAGDKGITKEQFVEKYDAIAGQAIYAKNSITAERKALLDKQETQVLTEEENLFLHDSKLALSALEAVRDNIDRQSSKHFTCGTLESFYTKKYEDGKNDVAWLEGLVNIMYNNKCYNSPVLQKAAVELHTLRPSSQSAYMLGNIALKNRRQKEALPYFDQAAELEANREEKAELHYEVASIYRNIDKAQAKRHAMKALELNPKSGSPYLLLAEMYSSVAPKECGLTDFERKALAWLAVETVKKAELAEPKYKRTVATLVNNYSKKIPTKADAKAAGKRKGDVITYGCWINETVTLPKL